MRKARVLSRGRGFPWWAQAPWAAVQGRDGEHLDGFCAGREPVAREDPCLRLGLLHVPEEIGSQGCPLCLGVGKGPDPIKEGGGLVPGGDGSQLDLLPAPLQRSL